jgi:hypothetical protein
MLCSSSLRDPGADKSNEVTVRNWYGSLHGRTEYKTAKGKQQSNIPSFNYPLLSYSLTMDSKNTVPDVLFLLPPNYTQGKGGTISGLLCRFPNWTLHVSRGRLFNLLGRTVIWPETFSSEEH